MVYDFLIIGAGIVGLSIARELNRLLPDSKIKVLEKEPDTGFIIFWDIPRTFY